MNHQNLSNIIGAGLMLLILMLSCSSDEKSSRVDMGEHLNQEGRQLMQSNCVTCHSPSASMDNRHAPPMIAVKKHYIDDETRLEEFSERLQVYLKNPSEENSIMPGAVRKFGLMPKLGFTEEQIANVAEYIFYADFKKPDWFDQHYEEEHGENGAAARESTVDPLSQGLKYAMATKAILGKNLMGQITAHGTESALSFCNAKAIHLTDSMATAQNVKVKRVSDQARNPDNQAEGSELEYILSQKEKLRNGEEMKPLVYELQGSSIGYYPITTNGMCLQCHGTVGEDIKPEIEQEIKSLYPADQATGYAENELRGIWVIEF